MGVFDHTQTDRCGTWCETNSHYTKKICAKHTYCIWCQEQWPCDTASTREDIAMALLNQPELHDYWHAARLIAPWLDEFKDN